MFAASHRSTPKFQLTRYVDGVPVTQKRAVRCSCVTERETPDYTGCVARRGVVLEREIADSLLVALEELGIRAEIKKHRRPAPRQPDFIFEVDGRQLVVEVKSAVGVGDSGAVIDQLRVYAGEAPALVAADRIAEGAKERFKDAGIGYYDRRGRLRLVVPGTIIVDAPVRRAVEDSRPSASALRGEAAKEVAIALLSEPQARFGVRELARDLGRSPSSISEALRGLQDSGLVTSEREPLIPDLFWELETNWLRRQVPLAGIPQPGHEAKTDPLQLGFGSGSAGEEWSLDREGWALTDTLGAAAWGMQVVASASYPPDLYVPSPVILQRALATYGRATDLDDRACTVSLAPARFVCRRRFNRPGYTWPVADHVVVALDLAKDQSRGREILDGWKVPEGITRVW